MEKITDLQGENDAVSEMTVYEVSYLLLPSITEEQAVQKATALKGSLVSLNAEVISDENPVLIDLAYSMTKIVQTVRHKVTSGYFGWIKFEMESLDVEKVKKVLDFDDLVTRYLIVKTVKENTLLSGKMKLKSEDKAKREEGEEEAIVPEITKDVVPEEIDKSIDDLVIA